MTISINKKRFLLFFTVIATMTMSSQSGQKLTINEGWKFHKGDLEVSKIGTATISANENDVDWQTVHIPHTWNDKDATDDTPGYYRGVGWYVKNVFIAAPQNPNAKTALYFEGANQVADLYVNGKWVGQHKGGYTRFNFDITSFVKNGPRKYAGRKSGQQLQ